MMDFDQIDPAVIIARGQYSTVRSAHEEEMKKLSKLTGEMQSVASQVLKRMQPESGDVEPIDELLKHGRDILDSLESCTSNIQHLATQKKELKKLAWP